MEDPGSNFTCHDPGNPNEEALVEDGSDSEAIREADAYTELRSSDLMDRLGIVVPEKRKVGHYC